MTNNQIFGDTSHLYRFLYKSNTVRATADLDIEFVSQE